MKIDRLAVFHERLEGEGEDGAPLLIGPHNGVHNGDRIAAVFDGLGGAGGRKHKGPQGNRSSAFYAARTIRTALIGFFRPYKGPNPDLSAPDIEDPVIAHRLRETIDRYLDKRKGELGADETGLRIRSSLIRNLPTTLALVIGRESRKGEVEFCAVWAGDSRCYALDPRCGLKQLTVDDLKQPGDALANLANDSPMSNFISADASYVLNHRYIRTRRPVVAFAATDGCFGYFTSPMHFEHQLLAALLESSSMEGWSRALHRRFVSVAADDVSLAMFARGWRRFSGMKRAFRARFDLLESEYIEPIDRWQTTPRGPETDSNQPTSAKGDEQAALRSEIEARWQTYKVQYEEHLRPLSEPQRRKG